MADDWCLCLVKLSLWHRSWEDKLLLQPCFSAPTYWRGEAGFDMPLVYTSLLVNKSYRIICWDSVRNPVQRSVQRLYPCEYAG